MSGDANQRVATELLINAVDGSGWSSSGGGTRDTEAVPPAQGVEPPPGTACWITCGDTQVPGIVMGWQQQPDGAWHALVSAWWPRTALTPRD